MMILSKVRRLVEPLVFFFFFFFFFFFVRVYVCVQ